MGSSSSTVASNSLSPATVDATANAKPERSVDNITWIVSSLKTALSYLELESVLCLHSVSKLIVWHAHNLGAWRILCLRDFPNARSQFHNRIILSNTALPDADAKAHTPFFLQALRGSEFKEMTDKNVKKKIKNCKPKCRSKNLHRTIKNDMEKYGKAVFQSVEEYVIGVTSAAMRTLNMSEVKGTET